MRRLVDERYSIAFRSGQANCTWRNNGFQIQLVTSQQICGNIYKDEATKQQYLKFAEEESGVSTSPTSDLPALPELTRNCNQKQKLFER